LAIKNILRISACYEIISVLYWANILNRRYRIAINDTRDQNLHTRFWVQLITKKRTNDPKRLKNITYTTPCLGVRSGGYNLIGYLSAFFLNCFMQKRFFDEEGARGTEYFDFLKDLDDEPVYLTQVKLFIYIPERELPPEPEPIVDAGGCRDYMDQRYVPTKLMKIIYDPVTQYNNCFFACLYFGLYNNIGKESDYDALRNQCGYLPKIRVEIGDNLLTITTLFDIVIIFYKLVKNNELNGAETFKEYKVYGINDNHQKTLHLIYKKYHYTLITNPFLLRDWGKCPSCYDWYRLKSKQHFFNCKKCTICGQAKRNENHKCRRDRPLQRSHIAKDKFKAKNLSGINKVIIADFETLTIRNDIYDTEEMEVYAVGWQKATFINHHLKNATTSLSINVYSGLKAIDKFCELLLTFNGTVIFYNGSRFDVWFIVRRLLSWSVSGTKDVHIKKILKDAGRLISFEFNKCKFWDLCLFTQVSLKQLCKDFGLDPKYHKKEFVHDIKSYQDVTVRKNDIEKYLAHDVLSLGVCYLKFISEIWRIHHYNAIKCISLSQLSWDIWRNNYIEKQYIQKIKKPSKKEYDFLRRSLFGGFCGPNYKCFKSSNDIGELDFNEVDDYLILTDVVSLYPWTSRNDMPFGEPRFRDKELQVIDKIINLGVQRTEGDEKTLLKSYVECCAIPPSDILITFLLSRNKKGQLEKDLNLKVDQVYDGATIIEAQKLGYIFCNIKSWLWYPFLGPLLKSFMEYCFEQKDNIAKTKGKDTCEYYVHKNGMNSFTGKTNQKHKEELQYIAFDLRFLNEDIKGKEKIIKKIEVLEDGEKNFMGFFVEENDYSKSPTKPLNFGVVILSQARCYMSQIERSLGCYKNEKDLYYYTDTDSLVIHSSTWEKHKHETFFGNKWGQLKDEFNGGKIIEAYFLAPKTYALLYWIKENGIVKEKWYIRAKGIPKKSICNSPEDFLNYKILGKDEKRGDDLGEVIYSLFSRDGGWICSYHCLPFFYFREMASYDSYTICHFGSIQRFIVERKKGTGMSVQMRDLHRSINYDIWWANGKRSKPENLFSCSYPIGYNKNE